MSTKVARRTMAAADLSDPLLAEASEHLIGRTHRRLPASIERLAGWLAQEMAAFRD